MAANHKYSTRGKSKLPLTKTSQVSVATVNATQDVTKELNEIMVDMPNSQGNTVSPSAMRAASRERARTNKKIIKSVPVPPPRPSAIKNKASLIQKNSVAKVKKSVIVRIPQLSGAEITSSEGEIKTVNDRIDYVSKREFLAVKQQLEAREQELLSIQEQLTAMSASQMAKDVKLRSYNGDGNVEQFLAQFHVTAALAEWPREDWGSRLATALDGRARQVLTVEPLTGKPAFEKLVALLRSRFGPESSPELWRQSLENRKRGEKETLAELSHNILEMASKAYPALELEIRKALAVTPFIRALQDEEQRPHVYAQAPRTTEEAIKTALAFENASKIEQRATAQNGRRKRAVTHDDDQLANPNEFSRGRGRKQEKGDKQSEAISVKAVTESGDGKIGDKLDGLAKSMEALATTLGSRLEQVAQQLAHSAQDKRAPQQNFGKPPPRSSLLMQRRRSPQEIQQSCWSCGSTGHFKWECPEPHHWGHGPKVRPYQREAGNGSGRGSSGQTRGPQFQ